MNFSIKSRWIKKGFFIYLSISLFVLIGLFLTTDASQLKQSLHFRWRYLVPLLSIVAVRMSFDALALKVLLPRNLLVSLWQCFKIRLMGIYFAVAVPVSTSHIYFQAYLLSQFHLSYAESLAIITLRSVLSSIFFLILVPLYFVMPMPFADSSLLFKMAQLTFFSLFGIILFMIAFLFFPAPLYRAMMAVPQFFVRMKWLNASRFERWQSKSYESIYKVSALFRTYLRDNPVVVILSLFYIVISFLFEFLTANLVVLGLGLSVPFWQLFFLQFFVKIIVQYAPTPGGSGIDELTYAGLFALFLPAHSVPLTVFIWRFFHAYLLIFVGGIITFFVLKGQSLQVVLEKVGAQK